MRCIPIGMDLAEATAEDLLSFVRLVEKIEKECLNIPMAREGLRRVCKNCLEYHVENSTFWVKSRWRDEWDDSDEEEDEEEIQWKSISEPICGFVRPKLFWPAGEGDKEDLEWLCERLAKLENISFRKAWAKVWVYSFETDIPLPKKCKEIMEEVTDFKAKWF